MGRLHPSGPKSRVVRRGKQCKRQESIGYSSEGKSVRRLQRQSPRQQATRKALFVPPSSQPKSHSLSRHAIIAPITKGKQAPRKVSVFTIPLSQKTCGTS